MGGLEAGGVAGVLVGVIVYLINANRIDRVDYRAAVVAAENRHAIEVEAHERTQDLLDSERKSRRRAEDMAARAALASERATEELTLLRLKIARLEEKVRHLTGEANDQHPAT